MMDWRRRAFVGHCLWHQSLHRYASHYDHEPVAAAGDFAAEVARPMIRRADSMLDPPSASPLVLASRVACRRYGATRCGCIRTSCLLIDIAIAVVGFTACGVAECLVCQIHLSEEGLGASGVRMNEFGNPDVRRTNVVGRRRRFQAQEFVVARVGH